MISRLASSLLPLLVIFFSNTFKNDIVVNAFSTSSSAMRTTIKKPCYLFPVRKSATDTTLLGSKEIHRRSSPISLYQKFSVSRRNQLGVSKILSNLRSTSHWGRVKRFRKSVATICMVCLLWFGMAGVSTPATHAASSAVSTSSSGNIFSRSIDQIVSKYVKDHMFADDVYDSVEASYREAVEDNTKGTYPKALSDVTSSILGQEGVKADKEASGEGGVGNALTSSIQFLQKKGLSESAAIIVLASIFVVAGPLAFLTFGMIVGGASKRQMNRVMKQRYGDTYSVDATIKTEDDVELPDDDEDEDDEEDDDDDDEDDDED